MENQVFLVPMETLEQVVATHRVDIVKKLKVVKEKKHSEAEAAKKNNSIKREVLRKMFLDFFIISSVNHPGLYISVKQIMRVINVEEHKIRTVLQWCRHYFLEQSKLLANRPSIGYRLEIGSDIPEEVLKPVLRAIASLSMCNKIYWATYDQQKELPKSAKELIFFSKKVCSDVLPIIKAMELDIMDNPSYIRLTEALADASNSISKMQDIGDDDEI